MRTELCGAGQEFLGEMVRAWVFCTLHKYGLTKSKTWQIKKAGALLLQPTSASRLGASELGVDAVWEADQEAEKRVCCFGSSLSGSPSEILKISSWDSRNKALKIPSGVDQSLNLEKRFA